MKCFNVIPNVRWFLPNRDSAFCSSSTWNRHLLNKRFVLSAVSCRSHPRIVIHLDLPSLVLDTRSPILKRSRQDKEVLLLNNAGWLEKCRSPRALNLRVSSSLSCSDRWPGFGGSGGGVCGSLVASNDAEEYGLSNWKTFVAQWSSGEEDAGKPTEAHGALNGGLVSLPWGKGEGLGQAWLREGDEESVQRGEGTASLTASSDDFRSSEMSEFEKLSCLQIREEWKHVQRQPLFHLVSQSMSSCTVRTSWCWHSPSHTGTGTGSPADTRRLVGWIQMFGPNCQVTAGPSWECEENLLPSLLSRARGA